MLFLSWLQCKFIWKRLHRNTEAQVLHQNTEAQFRTRTLFQFPMDIVHQTTFFQHTKTYRWIILLAHFLGLHAFHQTFFQEAQKNAKHRFAFFRLLCSCFIRLTIVQTWPRIWDFFRSQLRPRCFNWTVNVFNTPATPF